MISSRVRKKSKTEIGFVGEPSLKPGLSLNRLQAHREDFTRILTFTNDLSTMPRSLVQILVFVSSVLKERLVSVSKHTSTIIWRVVQSKVRRTSGENSTSTSEVPWLKPQDSFLVGSVPDSPSMTCFVRSSKFLSPSLEVERQDGATVRIVVKVCHVRRQNRIRHKTVWPNRGSHQHTHGSV